MKSLTHLSIDIELKKYAIANKVNLSRLLENALKNLIATSETKANEEKSD